MIDGIDGYKLSIRGSQDDLIRELHTLCRHLKSEGVTTLLVDEVDTVTGEFRATNVGLSYIADNIIFLRHIEFQGELKKTIGVLKKRLSSFERKLREFEITGDGIVVGEPLRNLRGILQGTPEWVADPTADEE
jgi:circadian clock protein KaiC